MSPTAFRIGAAAWMFTGVVHDLLKLVLPGDAELEAAMEASTVELGPLSLDAASLNLGVSLTMGLAIFVTGLLLWLIAGVFRETPGRLRLFGIVALASSVVALALAAMLIPGPPLVTFAVATVAFSIAWIKGDRTSSSDQESEHAGDERHSITP